jgi:hypothetical protein
MSPKIGTSVSVKHYLPASLRPLDLVRMAANVLEAQGLHVALDGTHGVGRNAVTGGWASDRRRAQVSLFGAICLVLQPSQSSEIDAGVAEALNMSPPWVTGLGHGFAGEADAAWLERFDRRLYLAGLRAGHLLFGELTKECADCGERRGRGDELCPVCG